MLEKINLVKKYRKSPGRLLDVGCAAGEFLAAMKTSGWQVEGLDISLAMCEHVKREYGITCYNEAVNDISVPVNSFDVVTFWASMEHVPDPRGALRACKGILREHGLVVILVPNANSLEEKYLSRWDENAIDVPRHLYHFSPAVMKRLLSAEGFEVVAVKHHTLNAVDRTAVIACKFIDKVVGGRSVAAKTIRVTCRTVATLAGDLISRCLGLFGRSHTFIVIGRKATQST